jgi:predicted exporter
VIFRHRQFLGWGLLALAALLGGGWLARLDYHARFSTDVLDLIPAGERAPELALVRQLASQAESRTTLFVLTTAGAPAPPAAAQRFAAELARSPDFTQALPLGDTAARDALGRELFAQRFALLFPRWLREREATFAATGRAPDAFPDWLAAEAAAALERFLATPEALAFQDLIPADPLLLLPGVAGRVRSGLGLVPAAATSATPPTLVWARLAAPPLSEAGQQPVFATIDRATLTVRAEYPGFAVAWTGINRFAAASRARIEREVKWINALSLAAVLAVALAFLRTLHRGLHLVPVILFSTLGAWVWTTLAFERLHVLVFVVGSLLSGVAIDYGFYLFMQPPLTPGEDYWSKVRRLAKPLLSSCFTTVAGFALLVFSELPLIRQLGVFVGTGLLCALAAAVVYFSTVANPFLAAREFRGGQALPAGWRRAARRVLLAAWLLSLPGLAHLNWRDDIRDLEVPAVELKREDARIRALFGEQPGRTAFLTYGAHLRAARGALEKFAAWLAADGGPRTVSASLAAVVPTPAEYERAVRFAREHPEFADRLRAAFAQAGFDAASFAPFFADLAPFAAATDAGYEAAVRAFHRALPGPLGLLLHDDQPLSWFVTIVEGAPPGVPPPATHTVGGNQLQTLNLVFARYRQSALWLSLIGLAIVGGGVFLAYGFRDGARIFAIPCGTCLGLFGLLGWLGQPLNLFHLLGAFLGVCLTHNYSIFSATSAYRREPPPISVRLSALTTAAAFGVLALSGIPVVRALGSTVALMVVISLLAIEFEHLAELGKSP